MLLFHKNPSKLSCDGLAQRGSASKTRCNKPCPLYPQERTCAVHSRMSALGQKRTFPHGHIKEKPPAKTNLTADAIVIIDKFLLSSRMGSQRNALIFAIATLRN
jgi:hypothetical protein